jgi:hypothetical protein
MSIPFHTFLDRLFGRDGGSFGGVDTPCDCMYDEMRVVASAGMPCSITHDQPNNKPCPLDHSSSPSIVHQGSQGLVVGLNDHI